VGHVRRFLSEGFQYTAVKIIEIRAVPVHLGSEAPSHLGHDLNQYFITVRKAREGKAVWLSLCAPVSA
jgi:hypothetical protein